MSIIKRGTDLKIPGNELLFIDPKVREKLLLDMISEYKMRYPALKPIVFFKNDDPNIMYDYFICFEFTKDGRTIIAMDMPIVASERSAPGYRFCKRENKLDEFFADSTKYFHIMLKEKFYEYIKTVYSYDIQDKNSPKYWKRPENLVRLIDGLMDTFLRVDTDRPQRKLVPDAKAAHVIKAIADIEKSGQMPMKK